MVTITVDAPGADRGEFANLLLRLLSHDTASLDALDRAERGSGTGADMVLTAASTSLQTVHRDS
jgi:hypothetical protein